MIEVENQGISGLGPPRGPHLPGLDGLRGIAILAVLFFHSVMINPTSVPKFWLYRILQSFWMGVDLFFVLSGFLITGILIDSLASPHYFRNFYMRRALRIFPLYYATILVLILAAPSIHLVWHHKLLPLLTYTNRVFIDPSHPGFNFHFGGLNDLTPYWSLAVEEQFYFIWPLLIFLIKRPQRLIPIALCLSLAAVATRIFLLSRHTDPSVMYQSLACRADSLLAGALVALLVRHGYRRQLITAARPIAMLCLFALVGIFCAWHGEVTGNSMGRFGFDLLAVFFASLVALTLNPVGIFTRCCSLPLLRFFGRYSYGLYILHPILPIIYASYFRRSIASLTPNLFLRNALYTSAGFAVTLTAALLSFHFLEKPFLNLKKYFPSLDHKPHRPAVLAEQHDGQLLV